jgi:hypothetical protein
MRFCWRTVTTLVDAPVANFRVLNPVGDVQFGHQSFTQCVASLCRQMWQRVQ